MNQERRLATVVKVVALALIVTSVSVVAYSTVSSNYLSGFSLVPYSTASYNTTSYNPNNGYSLYVTADNCRIEVLPSADNSLKGTLEVSNSFFYKAFANIQVTERSGVFTFEIITPNWAGTDATAYIYVPSGISAGVMSVVAQNGAISFDSPGNVSSIVLETTNGEVNLAGAQLNDATVQTTNGNLYISMSSFHDVIANTVNGNVATHVTAPVRNGSLSLTATNGNVEFYANPASNLTITASTVNGAVSVSNLTYTASQFTLRQFVGTVNSGGTTINLTTINGNVRITGS